ncbi:MAG: preprotein translocase subunit SecE [Verrucomicrobiota bacterium]
MSNLAIIIWVVLIGSAFAYLWWQGHIRRVADYWKEMWEELKKCSWPTWDELKGSTTLIFITMCLLGLLTFLADTLFSHMFFKFKL